ncbi:ABC transporter ATP-binding protein [Virgibacillus siamensis]|uniref:ABC transporter ATP-binding protein n=1 Tax=Virgibacillus siamensis TaxID=480071 RepID=UPI0009853F11|nr:ATP-binding cassette domain-containing protein [Virgibacillus siamensis]
MLEVKGISYRYDNDSALFNQIHININPGEIVGLYGKSGSGKTTMAKIIAGYFKPDKGYIKADDKHYPIKGPQPVQLVWQHPERAVNPRWRIKKILFEAGQPSPELLNDLGISQAWLNRFPSELSGDELQRICLARALCSKTKYLIADEMTTMLDATTQAHIWNVIHRLAKQHNLGILAISHELHLLRRVSSRVINFDELVRKP